MGFFVCFQRDSFWLNKSHFVQRFAICFLLLEGGNGNGTFGFVGCFRGLVLKGKHIDLVNIVEQDKPFGVVTGTCRQ